jgi:hypothetical protein
MKLCALSAEGEGLMHLAIKLRRQRMTYTGPNATALTEYAIDAMSLMRSICSVRYGTPVLSPSSKHVILLKSSSLVVEKSKNPLLYLMIRSKTSDGGDAVVDQWCTIKLHNF